MKSGNSVEDYGRADFSDEEIIDLYYRYEHEFNYVASYLGKLGIDGYCVAIMNDLEQVCFDLSAGSYDGALYRDYTELGYEKDEEFERCVKIILVDGDLGYLNYGSRDKIFFGPNNPIQYIPEEVFLEDEIYSIQLEETYNFGRLEGNWYYYEQDFV